MVIQSSVVVVQDDQVLENATGISTLTVPVGQAVEPVSLQEAKDHLRVVLDDEDDYISMLITAARQMAEGKINRAIVPQTFKVSFEDGEKFYRLPKPPFIEIVSVTSDGVEVDSELYKVDDTKIPARLVPASGWPANAVVEYNAGYTQDEVPEPIVQWIKIQIATMYAQREAVSAGVQLYSAPSEFIDLLLQPYMVYE